VIKQQSQRINHQLARDRHAAATADAVSSNIENVDKAGSGGKLIQLRGLINGYTRPRPRRAGLGPRRASSLGALHSRHVKKQMRARLL